MALFEGLGEKLKNVFSKLTNRGKLNEQDIKQAMREIRIALLEADVNFNVVKNFVSIVGEKAKGEEIIKSLTPGQMVIKLVNDELIELMGSTNSKLEIASKPPTVYLMVGLQGAGKTTMCGKLAQLLKKQGKKVLLVACDIYRPAAIEQLKVVGKGVGVDVFEMGTAKPVKIAEKGIKHASSNGNDVVIIDTAGRLHINQELMAELVNVKKAVNPTEILLTIDAMAGQEAVNVATTFNDMLDITGVLLTKMDSDTRGGSALSIKAVTGKPIKFCGTGEKSSDIEPFYPDRIASRILGKGDILSLIDKAQGAMDDEKMQQLEKRMKENSFTLDDFLVQYETIGKMGSLGDIMGMIPGMNKLKISEKDINEKQIARNKAILQSMTVRERQHPEIIKSSRRRRIAAGSGVTVNDVNQLLKQFDASKELMRSMKNGKRGNWPRI